MVWPSGVVEELKNPKPQVEDAYGCSWTQWAAAMTGGKGVEKFKKEVIAGDVSYLTHLQTKRYILNTWLPMAREEERVKKGINKTRDCCEQGYTGS